MAAPKYFKSHSIVMFGTYVYLGETTMSIMSVGEGFWKGTWVIKCRCSMDGG